MGPPVWYNRARITNLEAEQTLMSIKVVCGCGFCTLLPSEWAGKRVKCKCGRTFVVGGAEAAPAADRRIPHRLPLPNASRHAAPRPGTVGAGSLDATALDGAEPPMAPSSLPLSSMHCRRWHCPRCHWNLACRSHAAEHAHVAVDSP